MKIGFFEPIKMNEILIDHQIKGTKGITE
jgi:hypothetical protein